MHRSSPRTLVRVHEENAGSKNPVMKVLQLLFAAAFSGVLVAGMALPGVSSAGMTARDAANEFENMPSDFKASPPPEKTVVLSSDGKPMVTFFDKYRESVTLDKINPVMRKAIIAIEDSRFYQHGALDPKGAFRALATNVEAGQTAQGGSTLTQQYVKNLLVENAETQDEYNAVTAPTLGRKLRELRFALDLEKRMSKDQILEGYLNVAYFGAGAYGVQAASKRYFSKPAAKLNLEQAALLAGVTNSPIAFDPTLHPGAALQRRNTVLARMAQLGVVTKAEADAAAAKPIKLNETKPEGGCQASRAPFFCEYVRYEMLNILADGKYWKLKPKQQEDIQHKLNRGGYTIRTTLDWKAQDAAQKAVNQWVKPRDSKSSAQTMVEPGTGKIKALVVSRRFGGDVKKGETVVNLAADQKHGGGYGYSAGSTFKVFTLAAALDQGIPVNTTINSPQTTTVSGFKTCKNEGFAPYTLSNAGDSEAGNFNLRTGTEHSVNTFYALLEQRVGLCDSVRMAEKFGMKRADGKSLKQVPSQVLGANEIDVTHLAAAYAGFAARGRYCKPIAVTEVIDPAGKKLKVPNGDCKQVIDEEVADEVNDILKGVLTRGTASNIGGIGRPAAGKTGTCEVFTCALFAGHTPNLASAVWYGDAAYPWKNRVYGVYGATIPAPIWAQSMRGALEGKPAESFAQPTGDFGDETLIPDVKGMSIGAATAALRNAGFGVKIRSVPAREPQGTVVYTSPSGNTSSPLGTEVTIFVSSGGNGFGDFGGDNGGGFRLPF